MGLEGKDMWVRWAGFVGLEGRICVIEGQDLCN